MLLRLLRTQWRGQDHCDQVPPEPAAAGFRVGRGLQNGSGTARGGGEGQLAYVPDFVAFYPWMNVREALDYQASFRERWESRHGGDLLARFGLEPDNRSPD